MSFCTKVVKGNNVSCNPHLGGISKIKIAKVPDTGVYPASADFVEFAVNPEQNHFESTYAYTTNTGIGVWTTQLYLNLGDMDDVNVASVRSLCYNNVIAHVTTANGREIAIGDMTNPAYASAGNYQTGTANEDQNGVDITLTYKSTNPPAVVGKHVLAITVTDGQVAIDGGTAAASASAEISFATDAVCVVTPTTAGEVATWSDGFVGNNRSINMRYAENFTVVCA